MMKNAVADIVDTTKKTEGGEIVYAAKAVASDRDFVTVFSDGVNYESYGKPYVQFDLNKNNGKGEIILKTDDKVYIEAILLRDFGSVRGSGAQAYLTNGD